MAKFGEGRKFLIGGGQAAEAIAQFDWSTSPLGPIDLWPQSLKTALSMMLLSSFPKAIAWGTDLITFHNDAFEPILGNKPPALGRPFSDVWSETWAELKPMVDLTFAGQATFRENFEITTDRNGYSEKAYFTFCYSPIRIENGDVGGMMDTVIETTETVRAQERSALMNAELAHRMRNVLTMVGAVSTMTLRYATGLDEARSRLSERLAALGRNQSALSPDVAMQARIDQLLTQALAAHPDLIDQITASGPDIHLKPAHSLALSLALNELITNSIKHGALSQPEGKVVVSWDPAGFLFSWQESGVEILSEPTRQGFGTQVLMKYVPVSFEGTATIKYTEGGVQYRLTAPPLAVS